MRDARYLPWRVRLREDITAVQVDDELLLLDPHTGNLVRLDRDAAHGLTTGDASVTAALDTLGLTNHPDRRQVLTAAALTALGISVTALPTAATAASPSGSELGPGPGPVFSTGILDNTFDPNANASVLAVAIQADGRIVLGGYFTNVGGEIRNRLARVHANGTLDNTFLDPNVSGGVFAVAVQTDGKIVLGGLFANVGGVTRNCLARVNADGSLDAAFNANVFDPFGDYNVEAVAIQTDGRIVLGGSFANVGGEIRNRLTRVNADGTLDNTFLDPNVSGLVRAVAIQTDGRIVLGGDFTNVGGEIRNRLARVHANGALDTTFLNPNVSDSVFSSVFAVAIQTDGRIVLGGDFSTVGGATRNRLARVHANGALDNTFLNPNVNDRVHAVAVQTDSRIVLGGVFTEVGGQARGYLGRVDADGTLDNAFLDPNVDGTVLAVAIQTDGKIVLGGQFTNVNETPRRRIARLI